MTVTVKNLTNSPFDLPTPSGFIRLPAFGEVSGEFSGDYLQVLRHSMAVEVIDDADETPAKADPIDHDGDGVKGGSIPASEASEEIQQLRDQYTAMTGKKPHHLWKAARLQSEIDKASET